MTINPPSHPSCHDGSTEPATRKRRPRWSHGVGVVLLILAACGGSEPGPGAAQAAGRGTVPLPVAPSPGATSTPAPGEGPVSPKPERPPTRRCAELGVPDRLFAKGAVFSPDGNRVAIVGNRKDVIVVRLRDGVVVHRARLTDEPEVTELAAFLPGDRLIVRIGGAVHIVNLSDREPLVRQENAGFVASTPGVQILRGGRLALVERRDPVDARLANVDLVRVEDGLVLAEDLFLFDPLFSFSGSLSRDETRLLVTTSSGLVLYELPSRRKLWTRPEVGGGVSSADLSADGTRVALAPPGFGAAGVRLLDASTGAEVERLEVTGYAVRFFPDGGRLVVANSWGSMVHDLRRRRSFTLPAGRLDVSPDGNHLVRDDLALYAGDGTLLGHLGGPTPGAIRAMAFSAGGAALRILGENGLVSFDLATGTPISEGPRGFGAKVAALSSDGRYAAIVRLAPRPDAVPERPELTVLRVDDGATWSWPIAPLDRLSAEGVRAIAFSPDASTVAVETRRRTEAHVELYETSTGKALTTLTADREAGFAFTADGRVATLQAREGGAQIIRFESTPERTREEFLVPAREPSSASGREALALSPDGRFAFAGRGLFVDRHTGGATLVSAPGQAPGDLISDAVFAPAGGHLAVFTLRREGGEPGGPGVWPGRVTFLHPAAPPTELSEDEAAMAITFSRDGARLAVGRADGTVAIYCGSEASNHP
jgi:WD40 repeat protein